MRTDRRPRVLDVCCCQGAASAGYESAGLKVVAGVDKDPQPRYPYGLVVADAVGFLVKYRQWIAETVDFVHASPPCQHDSDCQRIQGNDHPDLIGPTREALDATGVPWVIENVGGAAAKLRDPVMLCGAMFGLATYRHRYFETGGGFTLEQPGHPEHTTPQAKMGRPIPPGWYGQFVGNFSGVDHARQVMGVPWMNRDGIRECIPPAYTRWIGERFARWFWRPA